MVDNVVFVIFGFSVGFTFAWWVWLYKIIIKGDRNDREQKKEIPENADERIA